MEVLRDGSYVIRLYEMYNAYDIWCYSYMILAMLMNMLLFYIVICGDDYSWYMMYEIKLY